MVATRIEGNPRGPGAFEVPSASTPGLLWTVVWRNAASHWCPCPRFKAANRCRHVDQVREAIRREWEDDPLRRSLQAARERRTAQRSSQP